MSHLCSGVQRDRYATYICTSTRKTACSLEGIIQVQWELGYGTALENERIR